MLTHCSLLLSQWTWVSTGIPKTPLPVIYKKSKAIFLPIPFMDKSWSRVFGKDLPLNSIRTFFIWVAFLGEKLTGLIN